ncbi:hypothetical protein ACN27E_02125 [Mycobacterium sp. WMMD1722]|uniref:hypothetical protein n=1 Tax=Mycobacterium sp. WMMD1722 TaxID=3404117 RepID=UPI003BF61035
MTTDQSTTKVARDPDPEMDTEMRCVPIDPAHYRSGRRLLVGEAVVLVALGAWAWVGFALTGAASGDVPVLGLRITLAQGAVLVIWGMAAALSALSRRSAVWFTAAASTVALCLLIVAAVASANSEPGAMGFDRRDILLYGVLGAANLALLYWLNADEIEGPAWVKRRTGTDVGRRR